MKVLTVISVVVWLAAVQGGSGAPARIFGLLP
jgi:hypothetical protein